MLLFDEHPHRYQLDAFEWLRHRTEAFVWLPLGWGKTFVAATLVADWIERFPVINRALVVGTRNIVENVWGQELEKWDHLQHLSYACATRSKTKRLDAVESKSDVLGINYENLVWFFETYGGTPFMPDILVLDEISKMKDHSTKRFVALAGHPGRGSRGYVPRFRRRIGLTATPASEGLMGMWAQEHCISFRDRLEPSIGRFRSRYCIGEPIGFGNAMRWHVSDEGRDVIMDKVTPITYNPDPASGPMQEAPEEIDLPVGWDPHHRVRYEEMEKESVVALSKKTVTAANMGVVVNKMRQLCGGCLYDEDGNAEGLETVKLEALEDAVLGLHGAPVIIFYQYQWEQDQILKRIEGARTLKGPKDVDAWNKGEIPALVLHPASAGHGLNLDGCDCRDVIWYSLPWSLEHYLQANARIRRPASGSGYATRIYRLLRTASIDEDVADRIAGKIAGETEVLERVGRRVHEREAA